MTTTPTHLYGTVGAEVLYLSLENLYENVIEPFHEATDHDPIPVEVWSVHDTLDHAPTAEALLNWVAEWVAENGEVDETASECWDDATGNPVVVSLAGTLLRVIAGKVNYYMAKDVIATTEITFDALGRPMHDGRPLFPNKRPQSPCDFANGRHDFRSPIGDGTYRCSAPGCYAVGFPRST